MIIKFRDATIKRFSTKDKVSDEASAEEIDSLHTEIKQLKEQLESNPMTVKLFSENESLLSE